MFRFEKLSEDNILLIKELFVDAFNEYRSDNEVLRKYNLEHIYHEYVSLLAFHRETNELAGFYGVIPAEFRYEGRVYLCGQICDLMTHSKYRRLGLFELMANEAHTYLKKIGFKFVYTLPYEGAISYFGFVNKLNFQESSMNSYSLKVSTLPISKKIQETFLSKIYFNYFKLICKTLFKNPNSINKTGGMYDRNQLIHNLKLFEYKSLLSKINFLIFNDRFQSFIKIDKDGGLSIGDLILNDKRDLNKIIVKFKILCFFGFIRYIHFEISESHYLNDLLLPKGVNKKLYKLCYLNFDENFDVDKIDFSFIDIDTF